MSAIAVFFAVAIAAAPSAEARYRVLGPDIVASHFRNFAANDAELYTNTVCNADAFLFMKDRMPRFECPDTDITRTWYFRWWTFRKHLRRTPEGWVVTEFLPNVGWAKTYNTIVCPAGHHLREARWLADASIAADDVTFWLSSTNSTHRWNYSSWLATGLRGIVSVTGDRALAKRLLDDAIAYYRGWEKGREWLTYPERKTYRMGADGSGLFTSNDDREGSEMSLGGCGYRPLMNAAMWSEAKSIAWIARLDGRDDVAAEFEAKAAATEKGIKERIWDAEKAFFMIAGVRELHGYAPWYFGMELPQSFSRAWEQVDDEAGFSAPFGLTFPERRAPGFVISRTGHGCQWNGPSWPFATSIALTGLANHLHAIGNGPEFTRRRASFNRLLHQYAAAQTRKLEDGRVVPWIDENMDPFTGEWLARAILIKQRKGKPGFVPERGKDYNHSSFCDIVVEGLCGFIPREDGKIEIKPLAPPEWDWWCLDGVRYHGRDVTVLYDKYGTRYGHGTGLVVLPKVDRSWDIADMKADYIVYVPEQPKDEKKTDPAKKSDSCNEHFHVIWDAIRRVYHAFWTQATTEITGDLHIVYSRSEDRGKTWSRPVTLAGPENRIHPRMQAYWQLPFLAKSGRLYCLWNQCVRVKPSQDAFYGFYSDDGGITWSRPELVGCATPAGKAIAFNRPAWINWQLPLRLGAGGKPLAACSTRRMVTFWQFDNLDESPEIRDIAITEFCDGNAQLSIQRMKGGPYFTPEDKFIALQEGSIVKLPDGRLFTLMRSTIGHPVWSQSRDGGRTWDDPKILRERDGGRVYLHSLSPCPMYDWKGPEAGSGYYFALIHDEFDFSDKKSAYRPRGPLKLIAGKFEPGAEQPISFAPPKPYPSRKVANACYSSYTVVDGEGVLWQPDAKYNLIGRIIGPEWFADVPGAVKKKEETNK